MVCDGAPLVREDWAEADEPEPPDLGAELLSMEVHDLCSTLSTIEMAARELLLLVKDPRQRELASIIAYRTHAHRRLVESLLEVQALHSNAVALNLEAIPLRDFLRERARELDFLVRRRGHRIEVDIAPEGLEAHGDPALVSRILENLVVNAAKYTCREDTIRLVARPEGSAVRFEVTDGGPGIPEEERREVFASRFRGAAVRHGSQTGLGLGLAICERLVRAHEGRIWVESSTPRGCRVIFVLPGKER